MQKKIKIAPITTCRQGSSTSERPDTALLSVKPLLKTQTHDPETKNPPDKLSRGEIITEATDRSKSRNYSSLRSLLMPSILASSSARTSSKSATEASGSLTPK